MRTIINGVGLLLTTCAFAPAALAAEGGPVSFGWTADWAGIVALIVFVVAYALVIAEERLQLRKSKPVVTAAALIWAVIGVRAAMMGDAQSAEATAAFRKIFLEFAELFFFLLVAMSYVAAIAERNVFEAMRAALASRGWGYRRLFWLTGLLGFFLSAVLDNLTTALVMSGVILAVGVGNGTFVRIAFINLVVAANAGGAWSAFGDITTLMAWQAGKAGFFDFFHLFVPSAVTWLVPAALMHFAVPKGVPPPAQDAADVRTGGWMMCVLLGLTIAITVTAKQLLHLPAVFGMMAGLGMLQIQGYWLYRRDLPDTDRSARYSIFRIMAAAEWDTLLFFYGVLLAVGGLATIGYLQLSSDLLYGGGHFVMANVVMGLLSAIVDNIPIMYAVLQMNPSMDHGQWLLITLTTGVGGSLLAVGSAAGVALMGQSRGLYTFGSHLRWAWAVAIGYAAGIAVHLWWNAGLFGPG